VFFTLDRVSSFCATCSGVCIAVKHIHYITTMETDSESCSCRSEVEGFEIFVSGSDVAVSDCDDAGSDSEGPVGIYCKLDNGLRWICVEPIRHLPVSRSQVHQPYISKWKT
jgi:hypothetical protein